MGRSSAPRAAPVGAAALQSPHLMRLASDVRLVAMIREGRRIAFDVAYDRHHLSILSFCRYVLGDPQEAEDAVQHTFLAAYSDLISSDKPIQLRAWLFAIARNRCYTVLRARRELPATELIEPATEGLATQVQRRQDLRDLVFDMRRLPDAQRTALVLAELDALSHEQIGAALGVPREKVKALVFQARESLVASRAARETDCRDIRAELATQRGGALRRGNLRRHLRECPGCRDFRREVERDRRRRLLLFLPMLPALKSGLMKGAIGVGVAAAGAGTIAAAGNLGLPWSSSPLPARHGLPSGSVQPASPALAAQRTALVVTLRGAARFSWPSPSARSAGSLRSRHALAQVGAVSVSYPNTPGATPSGSGRREIPISPATPQAQPAQSAAAPSSGPESTAPEPPASSAPETKPTAAVLAHGSGGSAGPVQAGHDGRGGPGTVPGAGSGKVSPAASVAPHGQSGSGTAAAGASGASPGHVIGRASADAAAASADAAVASADAAVAPSAGARGAPAGPASAG
jgi:RNA polymerase sigma factor (sigma-70 family)